jgi:hypothetical protein
MTANKEAARHGNRIEGFGTTSKQLRERKNGILVPN